MLAYCTEPTTAIDFLAEGIRRTAVLMAVGHYWSLPSKATADGRVISYESKFIFQRRKT